MTNHLPMRRIVTGVLLLSGLGVAWALADAPETPSAGAGPTLTPATSPATSVPASQPAEEIVLVRVGDKPSGVITQAEFNSFFFDGPEVPFDRVKDQFMRELVERKWFLLYIEDHPELNVESVVREQADLLKKRENLKTDEELDKWLRNKRMTLEVWRRQWRIQAARTRLNETGDKRAADEELVKKTFEAAPNEFNGTRLAARHILIGTAVYETLAERRAKREQAEKIREELVSGKRTWEDALKESTDNTKSINGNLGSFNRHQGLMEDLAAICFPMEMHKIGEVVETLFGYHIIELIRRDISTRSFEESKPEIKRWLRRQPYIEAVHEAAKKYPVTGVRPPLTPTRPSHLPERQKVTGPQTKPAFPIPTTRPAQNRSTTRPAPLRPTLLPTPGRPATRPAPPLRPTTRPAVQPAPGATPRPPT